MKTIFLLLLGFCLVSPPAFSQESVAPSRKKTFNSNIYEKEKVTNVSGKVKTTRTVRGETSVYFEGLKKSGPYILSGTVKDYTKLKNRLVKSAGPDGPAVTVTIDDQDNILSVDIKDSSESEETKD